MNNIIEVNAESEIDRLIAKLERLKALKMEAVKLSKEDEYLTAKDVAERLGVSENAAREYMNRPDFPALKVGLGYKVSAVAFALYNLERRCPK